MTEQPVTGSHPLGDLDGTQTDAQAAAAAAVNGMQRSIVDTIFDFDELESGNIRLAITQAAWYTRADLEAQIEALNAELDSLTDSQGRPLPVIDESMAEVRSARTVASELAAVQKTYAASRRVVLMQQLDEDDFQAFQSKWKDDMAKGYPYPAAFYVELITRCAIKPTISEEQLAALRKKVGRPAYDELWRKAWNVNTQSGVSIPKSSLSSAVLSQQQRG